MSTGLETPNTPSVGLVETVLRLVFGGIIRRPFSSAAKGALLRSVDPLPSITWNAPTSLVRALQCRGYRSVHRFIVLPSRTNPKWLLPGDNRRAATSVLGSYTAHSRYLPKLIAAAFAALGWPCSKQRSVLVASRELSYFEAVAREINCGREVVPAIALGTPGIFRKISVRWMSNDGQAVCYLKVPLTPCAGDRIRHEAATLEMLSRNSDLQRRIPRLMDSGDLDGVRFLVQSPLKGGAGPIEFGTNHEELLQALCRHQLVKKPGNKVVEAVAVRFRRNLSSLGPHWKTLGVDVLRRASQNLRENVIPCSWGHGDFAPWNTRFQGGRLSVFDWEAAAPNVPYLWDKFHFVTQARSLLSRGNCCEDLATDASDKHALYLLYLLDSAGNLAVEKSESNGVAYREQELLKELRRNPQEINTWMMMPFKADSKNRCGGLA